MKNTFYILLLGVLLSAVSCQKEDIQPQTDTQTSVSDQNNNKKGIENSDSFTDTRSDNPNITDPNRDEDDEERIKRD